MRRENFIGINIGIDIGINIGINIVIYISIVVNNRVFFIKWSNIKIKVIIIVY